MQIRTVNALIALGVFGLFVLHTILNVQTLIAHTYISWSHIPGMLLFALVIIHAVISIFLAVKTAVLRNKEKIYFKLNNRTIFLIITGLVILVLIFIHNISFGHTSSTGEFILREPDVSMFVVNVLLTVAISFHCALSLPNASISLGIYRESNRIPVKITTLVLSFGIGLAGIISYCLYYLPAILTGGVA